jgi:hypothetical protein
MEIRPGFAELLYNNKVIQFPADGSPVGGGA